MALGTALFAIAMVYFLIISPGFRKFAVGALVVCGIGLFVILYQYSKDKPQAYNPTVTVGKRAPNPFDQFDQPPPWQNDIIVDSKK